VDLITVLLVCVLVSWLVQFCLTIGVVAGSAVSGLLLRWASISVRAHASGVVAGVAGVVVAVAFGFGTFLWLFGPSAFTLLPFLACTLPLFIPMRNDLRKARALQQATAPLQELATKASDPEPFELALAQPGWMRSCVLGQVVGLMIAAAWFFLGRPIP
jgi:hypothetical protein